MKKMLSLFLIFTILFSVSACSDSGAESEDNPEESSASVSDTSQVVYEDEYAKVTFVELYEVSSVPDTGYIRLIFENKSDQEITIYPKDTAVNDTAVMYASGFPGTMQAGENFNQSWFFTFANAGISELSEVEKLKFSLWIVDENTETLVETERIEVIL